jgi:hypothetical protein
MATTCLQTAAKLSRIAQDQSGRQTPVTIRKKLEALRIDLKR